MNKTRYKHKIWIQKYTHVYLNIKNKILFVKGKLSNKHLCYRTQE